MANQVFKINPEFQHKLDEALQEFVYAFAQACRDVIELERYWEGWETSNPIRDIVDTNALNASLTITQIKMHTYRIRWATAYVVYVYMGYALSDGRNIPARKWVDVAMAENDFYSVATHIFNEVLSK
jgi:hypothetical protein